MVWLVWFEIVNLRTPVDIQRKLKKRCIFFVFNFVSVARIAQFETITIFETFYLFMLYGRR